MIGAVVIANFGSAIWSVLKIAIPVPLVVIAAAWLWMHFDKSSEVRQAVDSALEDFVHGLERAALAAKLAEERRLRAAAETALAGFTRALSEADKRDATEAQLREQETADYERKLAEAGRSCLLDRSDVDWLLSNP